jgi:uncharacterized protein YecA (UPF0149 family)
MKFRAFFSKSKRKEDFKLSRNELCYCGSGKKYKKCHWMKDQLKPKKNNSGKGLKEDISPRHKNCLIGD